MKTFVKVFLLVVVLGVLAASAVFAAPAASIKDNSTVNVTITPTLYKDLLILKADKMYLGATIEVRDVTGVVVTSSHIYKKKMIIDFYDIPYGTYKISVRKDKETFEFNYTKKQDSEI
jgi:hypothetical protein